MRERGFFMFGGLLSRLARALDLAAVDLLAMNYLFSTRDDEFLKECPHLKGRQALSAIDLIRAQWSATPALAPKW
jgi:hypothetical protein